MLCLCFTACANGETSAVEESVQTTTTSTSRFFEVITATNDSKSVTTTTFSETDVSEETTVTASKQTTTTPEKATSIKTTKTSNKTTVVSKSKTLPVTTTQFVPVVDSFFNDALFVGDSVSLKLKLYTINQINKGKYPLGHATFFTAGSFGWNNSLWSVNKSNSVHPMLNGKKMQIADAVVASNAKKVFLMLGINDLGPYGVDGAYSAAEKVINEIKKKSPDTVIYIQSVTPIAQGCERGKINNSNVQKLNEKFKSLCKKEGYIYLDIWSIMGGYTLKREYCSDPDGMGIHFTNSACQKWIDYLNNSLNVDPKPPVVTTTTTKVTTTTIKASTTTVPVTTSVTTTSSSVTVTAGTTTTSPGTSITDNSTTIESIIETTAE